MLEAGRWTDREPEGSASMVTEHWFTLRLVEGPLSTGHCLLLRVLCALRVLGVKPVPSSFAGHWPLSTGHCLLGQ